MLLQVNEFGLTLPVVILGVRVQGVKGKCPEVNCQFVRYSKNKDFSWLQLVNEFGLMVPVSLLGVRVQGV